MIGTSVPSQQTELIPTIHLKVSTTNSQKCFLAHFLLKTCLFILHMCKDSDQVRHGEIVPEYPMLVMWSMLGRAMEQLGDVPSIGRVPSGDVEAGEIPPQHAAT
jgi:hypothetical protein